MFDRDGTDMNAIFNGDDSKMAGRAAHLLYENASALFGMPVEGIELTDLRIELAGDVLIGFEAATRCISSAKGDVLWNLQRFKNEGQPATTTALMGAIIKDGAMRNLQSVTLVALESDSYAKQLLAMPARTFCSAVASTLMGFSMKSSSDAEEGRFIDAEAKLCVFLNGSALR
jgi:hypothetical protein